MLQRWYVGYFFYQFKSDKVKHEQTFLLGMSDINFLSISDMLKHFISDSDRTEVFSPPLPFLQYPPFHHSLPQDVNLQKQLLFTVLWFNKERPDIHKGEIVFWKKKLLCTAVALHPFVQWWIFSAAYGEMTGSEIKSRSSAESVNP